MSPSDIAARRWTPDRAHAWCTALPWLVGGNFTPSTASNQLEFWQAATFDPSTIERELGWAAAIGMTSMRIFLHDLCWEQDAPGFLARIDQVLAIAARQRIGALLVFFDSCWHPEPHLGVQEEPLQRVHNSRWVQSPGVPILRDAARFARLKPYVQGVLQRFRDDRRIHGWDLWNEPDNTNGGKPFAHLDLGAAKGAVVEPLLAQVFAWAREVDPCQPLTSGVWTGEFATDKLTSFQRLQVESSDVVSFHCYGSGEAMESCIAKLAVHGRPLWCSEYMARGCGSTFAGSLPVLHRHRVGAWNWGLVAGRTQTEYPWDSWSKSYTAEPQPWFHELFRRDGSPYEAAEVALIRRLTADAEVARRG
ncbi:MAG: 1,4-beta-xylanase [Planctomycetes bacterium]|nr:1,4-beta-xylanase [Planctomycetota bacterium]